SYKVSSTACGHVDSTAPGSTSAVDLAPLASNRDLDSTWAISGNAVMFRCCPPLLSQQNSSFELPPRPKFDLERSSHSSRNQINESSLAAKDLGLPRHFRLEEQGTILNL